MEFDTITKIILTIGIPSIVGALIYIGRKVEKIESLDNSMIKVKSNLMVVCNFLIRNHTQKFNSSELQSFSPYHLTAEGKALIEKIGFDNIFSTHKDDFFEYINDQHPTLKYDVESAAIASITVMHNKTYMDFLKIFFYNNPTRNLENTSPTLGVYIRDKYLEEHPEIMR